MRSISAMFNLDISSVDSMWIINGEGLDHEKVTLVSDEAEKFCHTLCADLYRESIVMFTDTIKKKDDIDALKTNIGSLLNNIKISYFSNLRNTGEVRRAYLLNYDYWKDAARIMPEKTFFVRGDIEFACACRRIVEDGDESVKEYTEIFDAIADKNNSSLVDTVCTYMLDANLSTQQTSELLFVHNNTIKYRIKSASDTLGFDIGSMPESERLFKACGVRRLLI